MSVQDALEGLKMLQEAFEKRNDRTSKKQLQTVKETMANLRAAMKQQGETERATLHEGEANKRNAASVGATYAGLNFKKKVYNETKTQPAEAVAEAVKGLGLPEGNSTAASINATAQSGNAEAAMKQVVNMDPTKMVNAIRQQWMAEKDPAKKTLLANALSQATDHENRFMAEQAHDQLIKKAYGPLAAKAATMTVSPGAFPEIIKRALKAQDGDGKKFWQNLDANMKDNAGDIKDQVMNNQQLMSKIIDKKFSGNGNGYMQDLQAIKDNMADQLMKSNPNVYTNHAMAFIAADDIFNKFRTQGSPAFAGKDYPIKLDPQALLNMSDADLLQFQPPTTTSPSPAAPAAPAATSTPAEAPSFGKSFSNNIINEPISTPATEQATTEPSSSSTTTDKDTDEDFE